jgi:hypothetical protein
LSPAVLVVRYEPQTLVSDDSDKFHLVPDIIWLNQRVGGVGGGGNRSPLPPRKAARTGQDKATVGGEP